MAQSESGSNTGIVAIVAIVMLVLVGFFVIRGGFGRGGGSASPSIKGGAEINLPTPKQ